MPGHKAPHFTIFTYLTPYNISLVKVTFHMDDTERSQDHLV